MVCAACCHVALVFAVMHFYGIFVVVGAFVHSFFILFKNLVLLDHRGGPRYQHVLALCAFLTGAMLKGLILGGFVFDVLCMFCYV